MAVGMAFAEGSECYRPGGRTSDGTGRDMSRPWFIRGRHGWTAAVILLQGPQAIHVPADRPNNRRPPPLGRILS
jgi:hypothetical protein